MMMMYNLWQTVDVLLGFAIYMMATIIALATPFVFGQPAFPSPKEPLRSDSVLDKANAYVHCVLEVIPNADKDRLLVVIRDILSKRDDASLDHILDIIFDKIGANDDVQGALAENEEHHVECGCCFSAFPFEEMVQCPETHLFCSPCMRTHASILLSSNNTDIRCVDQSGCTSLIPISELKRLLTPKMMDLWDRAQSRRALEAACLENLHYCPFCDWACIVEENVDGIFICRNSAVCGRASCLRCRKLDHRPNFCDDQLDGKHHIDEAMSGALIRQCPGCKKPFIKEAGCNRMKCSNCRTESCYICRQTVSGYSHFDQSGHTKSLKIGSSTQCTLWDPGVGVEERHAEEVKIAGKLAYQEYHQKLGTPGMGTSRPKAFTINWWRRQKSGQGTIRN